MWIDAQRLETANIDLGTPLPPLSLAVRRRYSWMRWITLGSATLACLFGLRGHPLWPGAGVLAALLLGYVALVRYQHGGYDCSETYRPHLAQHTYLLLSALLVFGLMLAPGLNTNGQSLWYCVMYFVVLSEAGRHLPTLRHLLALLLLCLVLVTAAVLLIIPATAWPVVLPTFLPLGGGLAVAALSAQRARQQELEHAERLTLLQELAHSKADLEEANRQLQVYASMVEDLAVANERARLARELHDVLGYTLATVVVRAEAARRLLARDPALATTELDRVQEVARIGLAEVRRSVSELRAAPSARASATGGPGVWHEATARFVEEFAREHGLALDCVMAPLPEGHAPELQLCLFRVIQEALTNVARHADAQRVSVKLQVTSTALELSVADDGRGMGPQDPPAAGFGLRGMRERVELLGGSLILSSKRGEGTRLLAMLPRSAALHQAGSSDQDAPKGADDDLQPTRLLSNGSPAARKEDPSCGDPR